MVDALPCFNIKVKNTFISGVLDGQANLQRTRLKTRALSDPPNSSQRANPVDAPSSRERIFSIKQHKLMEIEDSTDDGESEQRLVDDGEQSLVDDVKVVVKEVDECRHDEKSVRVDQKGEICEPEWEPPANESWDWQEWNEWEQYEQYEWPLEGYHPENYLPQMFYWPPMDCAMPCPEMFGVMGSFEQPYQILCPSVELAMRSLVAASPVVASPRRTPNSVARLAKKKPLSEATTLGHPNVDDSAHGRKQKKNGDASKGKKASDDLKSKIAHGGDGVVYEDLERPPGTFTEAAEKEAKSAGSSKPLDSSTETAEVETKSEKREIPAGTAEEVEDSATRFCTQCGGRMRVNFKFCGFCGVEAPRWDQ
jgi:hypothetical protein